MATLRKSRGGCDWLAGWVGSYHIRGFEGVPLATDAARDTETKTRILLYSHTQLEKEKKEKTKQTEKIKEKQVKVKCKDQNNLYVSIEKTACSHGRHAFMCRGTRFGSYAGGLQFGAIDHHSLSLTG